MRYLGSITRRGTLGEASAPSTLEIECYEHKDGVVTASGEIETWSSAIALFTSGAKLPFVTEDGHEISLTLADSKTAPTGTIAQILATGDLPSIRDGSLGWFEPTPR